MKQTAVEYIKEKLLGDEYWYKNITFEQIFEKAKAMEKEQIIDAYNEGQNTPYEYSEDNEVNWYDGKRYYNETFKSK